MKPYCLLCEEEQMDHYPGICSDHIPEDLRQTIIPEIHKICTKLLKTTSEGERQYCDPMQKTKDTS